MSSIPKALFIQQSDEGTDVFFLTQVGIYASPSKSETEWQVEKQHHISKEHVLSFFAAAKYTMPEDTEVTFDKDSVWFLQHEEQ